MFTENFDYVLNWLKIRKYSLALKYGLDNRYYLQIRAKYSEANEIKNIMLHELDLISHQILRGNSFIQNFYRKPIHIML